MESTAPQKPSLFANRNFVLLWIGQSLSVLGDQFALIGLPWLVLKLTGDPLALGTVLAFLGIPRALVILVGGALSDRFSSRSVMLVSDLLRLILFSMLAAAIFTGQVQLWMLYAFGLISGLLSGLFIPASIAIVPQVVQQEQLQTANSLVQGTAQMSVFLGPGIAGGLIALVSRQPSGGATAPGLNGIAVAFAMDAFSFLVSAVTLSLMSAAARPVSQGRGSESMLSEIRAGIGYAWQNPLLRITFVIIMVINLLFVGPMLVGIPVLADTRLKEGAAAFGLLMSAFGGGNLGGILLAGALARPAARMFKLVTVMTLTAFGLGLIALAVVPTTAAGFVVLFVLGLGNGYISLIYITMIQQRSPKTMLGRIMSLLMLANLGLVPISQAVTGALIKSSLTGVFAGAGLLIVLTGLWSATRAEILVSPDSSSSPYAVD